MVSSVLPVSKNLGYILCTARLQQLVPQQQPDPAQENTKRGAFPTFLGLPAAEVMKETGQSTEDWSCFSQKSRAEEVGGILCLCLTRLLFKSFFNCCQVVLGFGSLVLRLYFPSSGLFTQCYSNDFVELSSLVLYLTSVLSKSSLSTAEKFGAGFTEFLSC